MVPRVFSATGEMLESDPGDCLSVIEDSSCTKSPRDKMCRLYSCRKLSWQESSVGFVAMKEAGQSSEHLAGGRWL